MEEEEYAIIMKTKLYQDKSYIFFSPIFFNLSYLLQSHLNEIVELLGYAKHYY